MSFWLENLNPEQRDAVSHDHGPLLILAGAGSGKTTVLVARTGRLISEKLTTADRICVLTFTNKAATELKHRVAKKLGEQAAKKVWAGTFHGFGLQFLKEHWKDADLPRKFGVIDGNDAQAIMKDLMRDHRAYEKERFAMEKLLAKVSILRANGFKEKALDDTIESVMAVVLAPKFARRLRQLGVVDFEDLLLRPLQMMKQQPSMREKMQNRYDFLMVDEFQDTNNVQMDLVSELSASHRNIGVVGDDDQSIYGWRGAEVQNILGFPNRYKDCKVIRLERNYRSSSNIIDLANSVISNNKDRHAKVLRPGLNKEGQIPELLVFENEDLEVDQVTTELLEFHKKGYKWRDMAVLYRSNSQGGLMEGGMRRSQIPYKLTGGTALFDGKEPKDCLAFIRSTLYPTEVGFRRIINLPPRGVGEKTLEEIEGGNEKLEFHQRARVWAKSNPEDRAAVGILDLFERLEDLKTKLVMSPESAEDVLCQWLRDIGYRSHMNGMYKDNAAAEKRWIGVQIVGRILDGMFKKWGRTLDTLEKFIDSMELRDQTDDEDKDVDQVQMMTLHACKGLEFPLVFLLGLEEDLLPHARLGQNVDEERRLFYVGVTRAQKHLVMTRVRQRKRYGRPQPVAPSRFLLELDTKLYSEHEGGRPLSAGQRDQMVSDFLAKLGKKIAERDA